MEQDIKEFCLLCDEEHIVSKTLDGEGNVVGTFCNRKKELISSNTSKWNGKDIYEDLRKFARRRIDLEAVANIRPQKVGGLGRKMAYLYLQTPEAKKSYVNYYFAAYHMTAIVTRMRSEARSKGFGK